MADNGTDAKKDKKKSRFGTVRKSFRVRSSAVAALSEGLDPTEIEKSSSLKPESAEVAAPAVESIGSRAADKKALRERGNSTLRGADAKASAPPESAEDKLEKNSTPAKSAPVSRSRSTYKTSSRQDKILWPLLERLLSGMQIGDDRRNELLGSIASSLTRGPRIPMTSQTCQDLEADIQHALVIVKYTQLVVKAQSVTRRWLGVRRFRRLHEEFGGEPFEMLQRLDAFRDLLKTEETFVKNLDAVQTKIYPAMLDAAKKKQLGSSVAISDIDTVFQLIAPIIRAHNRIGSRLASIAWPELTGLGSLMEDMIGELDSYDSYMRLYKISQHVLDKLTENDKWSKMFSEVCSKAKLDVRALLGSPLKRVAYWARTLQTLSKATPAANAESKGVAEALRRVEVKHAALQQTLERNGHRVHLYDMMEKFVLEEPHGTGTGVLTESLALRKMLEPDFHGGDRCRLQNETALIEVEVHKEKEKREKVYGHNFSTALVISIQKGKLFKPRTVIDFAVEDSLTLSKSTETKGKDTFFNVTLTAEHGSSEQHAHLAKHIFSWKDESDREKWFAQTKGSMDYHQQHTIFGQALEGGIPKVLRDIAHWLRITGNELDCANLFSENIQPSEKPRMRRLLNDINESEFKVDLDLDRVDGDSGRSEEQLQNDIAKEALFMTFKLVGAGQLTAALKFYLHGLPQPLLGFDSAVKFAALSTNSDKVVAAKELRNLLSQLPADDAGKLTALFLLKLLADISARGKIDSNRLATYLSPVFVRQEIGTIEFSRQLPKINSMLRLLMLNVDYIAGSEQITLEKLIMPESHEQKSSSSTGASMVQTNDISIRFFAALHPFPGSKSSHLPLLKGDIIRAISGDDSAWLYGINREGREGKFPSNFCREVPAVVRVTFDWTPEGNESGHPLKKDELIEVIEQSPDGWWKGRWVETDETGFFPANFCQFELVRVPKRGKDKTAAKALALKAEEKDSSASAASQDNDAENSAEGTLVSSPSSSLEVPTLVGPAGKPYTMRAKFAFEARSEREISFKKDDIIRVIAAGKSGNLKGGWWTGQNETAGPDSPTGKFPSNYCDML